MPMKKFYILIFFFISFHSFGQITLSGSSYTQDFNGTTLPSGWTTRTGATASALGATLHTPATSGTWASTTGQFRFCASAKTPLTSASSSALQNGATDRCLAIRSTGSFGDPGQAFVLELANTLGFTNFSMSFAAQLLSPQGKTTIYRVDFGTGSSPSTFTQAGATFTDLGINSGLWGVQPVTINFGNALDNISSNVWIRIVSLNAASGSGNTCTFGIDDVNLNWTNVSLPNCTFTSTSGAVLENAGTYQIGVTVNTAPSADLMLSVIDAGTGTASPSTDFTFTNTDLTFTAASSYPQTQYVTVNILNDAIPEANKYRNFTLSKVSGPAVTFSNTNHQMTIIDDDVLEGVVLNEFSQGVNNASYLELVVVGLPGTTVDLRGWIIDDNSGIFSGGYGTQLGIADGHIKFSNSCTWEKVPVGSVIVIYVNDQTGGTPVKNDKITSLGLADDPTDANLDYVYVVGVNFYNTGSCSSAATNNYFSSDCNLPSNTSYDSYIPATYVNPDMGTVQFRNSGDAVQLRDPAGTYFMGLSYGDKGSSSSCGSCDIIVSNHPDYATYGSNALYFSGTSNKTYAFVNTNDNDYRNVSNWTKTTSTSPNALETPGSANSAANQTWINSLRGNFDVVMDNQNYTCQLRQYESRYYLDAIDKIIFYIKNNANINHGDLTAETILHDDATPGLGFQNSNLTGTPLFMTKTWAATPANYSAPNYKIKFFVSTQELQNYCDYINPILNALPGYYNAHNHTPAEVIGHLKIYKTATSDRAWTVTSDAQVEIKIPVTGTYTSATGVTYTTFEYDGFTGFSGYALGDVVTPIIGLPVELTSFHAKCKNDIVNINWTTASEENSNYFELERSSDAIHFTTLQRFATAQKSNQLKNYAYTDEYPLNGTNYYRLRQQDIGNTAPVYSNIIQTSCEDFIKNETQIYYTPDNTVMVNLFTDTDKNLQFSLYEISGKLLHEESKNVEAGASVFALNFHHKLAAGIYVIQMMDGGKITSKKILVH